MPHVRPDGADFVVSVFIVHPAEPRVLLVDHLKLGGWMPVGGHIGDEDPREDPDAALAREIRQECGLDVQVVEPPALNSARRPPFEPARNHNSRMLRLPWAVERHDYPGAPGHLHVALVYLARALGAAPVLCPAEHKAVRWFGHAELEEHRARMLDTVRWYGHEAILAVQGVDYVAEWRPAKQRADSISDYLAGRYR